MVVVLGQNVLAAGVLTLVTSAVLAVMAKVFSVGFGIEGTISIPDLLTISFVAAVMSSALLVVFTVALAAASTRQGWDPDNVMAPVITATGVASDPVPAVVGTSARVSRRPRARPTPQIESSASPDPSR